LCGIFGILIGENLKLSPKELKQIVNNMFRLSESRGKEASGLAIRFNDSVYVLKEPITSSKLIRTPAYEKLFDKTLKTEGYIGIQLQGPLLFLGHSRLQTNGLSEINTNNQPVVKDGAIGVHNGIIVNDENLWELFPTLKKNYDVDTEVFLSLLQLFRAQGKSIMEAVRLVFDKIEGSASVAIQFDDANNLLLATNTGSLYLNLSINKKILVFASEKYILQQVLKNKFLRNLFALESTTQIKAGQGYLFDLDLSKKNIFSLREPSVDNVFTAPLRPKVEIFELYDRKIQEARGSSYYLLREDVKQTMIQNWETLYLDENSLKRCTRCLLPETMPFISFDQQGVCSFCRDYETRGSYIQGEEALEEFVSKYRSVSGEPDVVVGFSGGRDSSYGLDYMVNHLGLHPITFTYDWGMVNDLARRNQARVVGKLGIEHIVVSADIRTKRANIRKNLKAWLKKPDLGMVPILMAGDKQFYFFFHKIRKQTGIKLFIFCGGYEGEEGTGLFKYGFCNVSTQDSKHALKRMTGISTKNKLKIMYYYLKQFIRNPAYINKSMIDTLFAYYSSYVLPDDYLYLFHFIDWDEKRILKNITEKFNWETEADTMATWRIDDGTAAFYNYIYLAIAGFTEFDIFRSHQIREGKLGREEAYLMIKEENKPRFQSIKWYGQAIDFDMNKAIEIINSAPKLYLPNNLHATTSKFIKTQKWKKMKAEIDTKKADSNPCQKSSFKDEKLLNEYRIRTLKC
jgi:glutamine---fructose-6-phosphate transaminase (isomerizing)